MHELASAALSTAPAHLSVSTAPRSDTSPLLTVPEAMRLLTVGRTTLYKLIGLRHIQLVKIGGASRVLRASIDAYIRSAEV